MKYEFYILVWKQDTATTVEAWTSAGPAPLLDQLLGPCRSSIRAWFALLAESWAHFQ